MNANEREWKIEGKALETSKPSAYNRNILIYISVHSCPFVVQEISNRTNREYPRALSLPLAAFTL